MASPLADKVLQDYADLDAIAAPWSGLWQECLRYCLPEDEILHPPSVEGSKRSASVDATAVHAAQLLGSALYSNTVALGREWFALRAVDEQLRENDEVKRWLAKVGDLALQRMQNSNFAEVAHEAFLRYVVLGTGIILPEMQDDGTLRFSEYLVPWTRLANGPDGRCDTAYRSFLLSSRAAASEFGLDNLSEDLRRAVDERPYQRHEFIHAVYKRRERDPESPASKDMPWASVYVERAQRHVLREGGYTSFPYAVFRFAKNPEETYGRSPAMRFLPAIRTTNKVVADIMHGTNMAINPPVMFFGELESEVNLRPGGITYLEGGPNAKPPVFYPTTFDAQIAQQFRHDLQQQVRDGFMRDLFHPNQEERAHGPLTATEINERANEKIQMVAPVVSRLQSELFAPLVQRVVRMLIDSGQTPPPPAALEGQEYEVVYTTRLNARLAQVQTDNTRAAVAIAAEVAAALEEHAGTMGPLVDFDRLMRDTAHAYNVPPEFIRTKQQAQAVRKAMEDAARQEAEADRQASMTRPMDMQRASEPGSPADLDRRGALGIA